MAESKIGPKITETIVLKKFNGDGPNDRTDQPLEEIHIENGKIIKHIVYDSPHQGA